MQAEQRTVQSSLVQGEPRWLVGWLASQEGIYEEKQEHLKGVDTSTTDPYQIRRSSCLRHCHERNCIVGEGQHIMLLAITFNV